MLEGISSLQHTEAQRSVDNFTILQYVKLRSCILTIYSAFNKGGHIQDRKLEVTKTLRSQAYYQAQIIRL